MNASRLRIPRVDAAGYMNRVVLAQHAQAKDSGTGAIRSSASPTTRAGISSRERFRDAHCGGALNRERGIQQSFGGLDIEVVGEVEHVEGHAAFEHAGFQPKIEIAERHGVRLSAAHRGERGQQHRTEQGRRWHRTPNGASRHGPRLLHRTRWHWRANATAEPPAGMLIAVQRRGDRRCGRSAVRVPVRHQVTEAIPSPHAGRSYRRRRSRSPRSRWTCSCRTPSSSTTRRTERPYCR